MWPGKALANFSSNGGWISGQRPFALRVLKLTQAERRN
jgi:hypothetical protein